MRSEAFRCPRVRGSRKVEARSLYAELTARQPRSGGEPPRPTRNAWPRPTKVYASQSATVSRMLLAGIADQLHGPWRGKRLVIVATGALGYLPFGSLPLPPTRRSSRRGQASRGPLITRHEIVEAPSASVLADLAAGVLSPSTGHTRGGRAGRSGLRGDQSADHGYGPSGAFRQARQPREALSRSAPAERSYPAANGPWSGSKRFAAAPR